MKRKTKISIDLGAYPVNDTKSNIEVTTVFDSMTGIEYTNMASYMETRNLSESTLRRMIKSAAGNRQDRLFVMCNGKYFVHELLAEKAFRNLPMNLNQKQSLKRYLQMFNWKIMVTVNFCKGFGELTTRQKIESFFGQLRIKFSRTNLALFFVVERNGARDGMHVHFLLSYGEDYTKEAFNKFIGDHFRGKGKEPFADILIEVYDAKKDGIGYLLKEIKLHPDGYDLLIHTPFSK